MEIINLHLLRPWSTCKVWISHADVSSAVWYELYDHPIIYKLNPGRESEGVETSGVERSGCDARVWVLPKRQTRWRKLYWTVREVIQRKWAIIPWHSFAPSNSEGTNYFSHVLFLCCSIFPREQISVLNIVPPPWPVCKKMASQLRW